MRHPIMSVCRVASCKIRIFTANQKGRYSHSVTDAAYQTELKLDTHTVWTEGWFVLSFSIDNTDFLLALGVYVDTDRVELALSFWNQDLSEDHTTGYNFGDD